MKNIREITDRINLLIKSTELSDFYEKRAARQNKTLQKRKFLSEVHGFEKDFKGYGYHWGGRTEMQFNVGFEDDGYFRYGLAFSLELSQSLPDPVTVLAPKIQQFNKAVSKMPAAFSKLSMWQHYKKDRPEGELKKGIPDAWVRQGAFIFVGEKVRVGANGINEVQIKRAVQVMAQLLPVYEYIETNAAALVETKVARLCWNTNLWERPSGAIGKSKNKDAYEKDYGFGHEEWLLDISKAIDGWKYGFIQALNHVDRPHVDKAIDLVLYTINDKTKARYWVAKIKNAKALTKDEAARALSEYEKRDWLSQMAGDLKALELNPNQLTTKNPLFLFNVKFKVDGLAMFEDPIQFSAGELGADYYGILQDIPSSQKDLAEEKVPETELRERNDKKLKSNRKVYASNTEIELVHKQWQEKLRVSLKKEFPKADVKVEINGEKPLDIYFKIANKVLMIELKTANSVRYSVREAFGQLMDYAFRDPGAIKADVLLVVGPAAATEVDRAYLELIRKQFELPLHYRQYKEGSIVDLKSLVDEMVGSPVARMK